MQPLSTVMEVCVRANVWGQTFLQIGCVKYFVNIMDLQFLVAAPIALVVDNLYGIVCVVAAMSCSADLISA